MRYLLLLVCLGFLSSCSTSNNLKSTRGGFSRPPSMGMADPDMPNEPGKCYAKCLVMDQYSNFSDTLARYTLEEEVPLESLKEVEVSPASSKWVKKKTDNCRSRNPDDCLVWCLSEEPPSYAAPRIEIDSVASAQFVIIEKRKLEKVGGYTEWQEVLCENDPRMKTILSDVQNSLNMRGFDCGPPDNKMSKITKGNLINFQKAHGLPIGQLDMKTLEALGVL